MIAIDLTSISISELDKISSITELDEWTKGCHACSLREESYQVTFASGDPASPIVFVGMNPGFCEDGTGIPFCGRAELAQSRCSTCTHYTRCYSWQTDLGARAPLVKECLGHSPLPSGTPRHTPPSSVKVGPYTIGGVRSAGQIFDDACDALGLDRTKVFITNTALCKSYSGDPKAEHIKTCSQIKNRAMDLIQPKVIVPLGNLSLSQYTAKRITMKAAHGKAFSYTYPTFTTTVIPTYHPSMILRSMMDDMSSGSKRNAVAINDRKWDLYEDIGNALNYLDLSDLAPLLLPSAKLNSSGKILLRSRPV